MAEKKRKQTVSRQSVVVICVVVVIVAAAILALVWKPGRNINSFQACKDAGGAILESYPEQCVIDGKSFTNSEQSVGDKAAGYVGLTEQAALDKATAENKQARVVERDGESLPVDTSFQPGRLNLHVKNNTVYRVQIEGEE